MVVCNQKRQMKVSVFHPGTQYSHQLVGQLDRLTLLYKFVTGLAFAPEDKWLRYVPGKLRKRLSNRILRPPVSTDKIKCIAVPELMALMKLSLGFSMEPVLQQRNAYFQYLVPEQYIVDSDAIIGFDTSSWILAGRAAELSKPFYLDQSIGHPSDKIDVYRKLRTQYPLWAEDIGEKEQKFIAQERAEHRLASKVIVASTFTRDSLVRNGVPKEKIEINPYGVGGEFFIPRSGRTGKRRLLYLGFLGARKGLPLLLDAWNKFGLHNYAEAWLAGPATLHAIDQVRITPGIVYQGRRPHHEVPDLLRECDVLVFPSYYEGFGQVILEAMAAGIPVITTEATAGPDIIEHQVDGWLFKTGDVKGLADAITSMANDRSFVTMMGTKARNKARLFSWEAYGDRWKSILNKG